ncbi:adenylate cyclase [Reyranella soli]|jgi:CYTH domain-containing protein|uniref:Adenylate cyclase n=2 Tax=Reyranella soli TaxID=1230389 RepID=A0A512NDU2_9HYPH|nr:adenylate cyclase [Reyranella soli]
MGRDMALEIERKFLVRDESWRAHCAHQQEIRDGLIAIADGRKVRVRICDQRATLTVKAKTERLANHEFEYEIPLSDAEELLARHCLRAALAKTRYVVPHGQHVWHVDVYKGILKGVVLAEVELPSETADVALPPWIGREVTGNPDYKKTNMVDKRLNIMPSSALVPVDTMADGHPGHGRR